MESIRLAIISLTSNSSSSTGLLRNRRRGFQSLQAMLLKSLLGG